MYREISTLYFPKILSMLTAGNTYYDWQTANYHYYPSNVNIVSFGLLGFKKWNGEYYGNASKFGHPALGNGWFYPAILGFSGKGCAILSKDAGSCDGRK